MRSQLWVQRSDRVAPTAERFEAVELRDGIDRPTVKPWGGLWTSTYLGPEKGSDWVRWCLAERFECERNGDDDDDFWQRPAVLNAHGWVLTPRADARIYTIDSYEDLRRLVHRFPHEDRDDSILSRDFPRWLDVSEHFEGVRLTERGQFETRLSHPLSLYGWDCESTLWFRWVFEAVEELGAVTWREPVEDDDDEEALVA